MNIRHEIAAALSLLLLAACGTQKSSVKDVTTPSTKPSAVKQQVEIPESSGFTFVQKVNDGKVTAQDIVANLTFSATMDGKDVSVPGSLHMRKDQMIRLQLFVPIIHTEVGRLEFTPDYVLVVDRLHKQYVKEDYRQLDFLRDNGLDFYALQALFWNQLYMPGEKQVDESDLSKFRADLNGAAQTVPVSLDKGRMTYQWDTDRLTGRIDNTKVTYVSEQHGKSTLTMKYANFKPLGAKLFPAYEELVFLTSATKKVKKVTMVLDMDNISTSSKWSTETTLPSKYKKIEAADIFSKLFNM